MVQAKPNEPGTKQLPRQLQKQAYNEALIKRYKHLPEVRRIERHRHIPKPLYKVKLIALMLLSTLDRPNPLLVDRKICACFSRLCSEGSRCHATCDQTSHGSFGWWSLVVICEWAAGCQTTPDHEGRSGTQAGQAHCSQQARLCCHQARQESAHSGRAGVGWALVSACRVHGELAIDKPAAASGLVLGLGQVAPKAAASPHRAHQHQQLIAEQVSVP